MGFRDRVVEFKRVKASELIPNKKNWRLHPEGQKDALSAVLGEIGFAGAVAARETPAGLELLDGHLRTSMAGDELVPVVVLDLNDEEAAKFLATFDPLAGMALTDASALGNLLAEIELTIEDESAAFRKLIADANAELEGEEEKDEVQHEVPGMALQPHEHYDYLVVLCTNAQEWNVLCDRLDLVPERRRGRMGTCRAVRAARLLPLLKDAG
jgi:hypothetical protein